MQVLDVVPKQLGREHALARPHPVHVSAQGIDFAVVGDYAVGMRARPAGEGVGRKTRVHDRQGGHHRELGQVREERVELLGGEHALVNEGARREACDVKQIAAGNIAGTHKLLGQATNQAQLALEGGDVRQAFTARHEDLANLGARSHGAVAKPVGIDRHVPPPKDFLPKLGDGLFQDFLAAGSLETVLRQKHHSDTVLLSRWQSDAERRGYIAQKYVRNLEHDPRAVARVLFAAAGAAVGQVLQYLDGIANNLVRLAPFHVHDQPYAARVVLVLRVIKAL